MCRCWASPPDVTCLDLLELMCRGGLSEHAAAVSRLDTQIRFDHEDVAFTSTLG